MFVLYSTVIQLHLPSPTEHPRGKVLRCIKGPHSSVKQNEMLDAEELLKLILVPTTIRQGFGITQLLVIESTLQGTLPGSIQTQGKITFIQLIKFHIASPREQRKWKGDRVMDYDPGQGGVGPGLCDSQRSRERQSPERSLCTSPLPREIQGNRPSDFSHMKNGAISWKCIFKMCGMLC